MRRVRFVSCPCTVYRLFLEATFCHYCRHIFYTDVGTLVPKVAKARTDGSNIQTLATKSPSEQALRTPTALALNRQSKTIYFGDMSLGEIFKMTYDGENLEKVSEVSIILD